MRDFHDLRVWSESHKLTLAIYKVTRAFPSEERFGLTSQIRRAATSVEANLAEGCGRQTDAELARFTQISMGSASELESHLLLARDLGFLTASEYEQLLSGLGAVRRMLCSLHQVLASALGQEKPRAKGQRPRAAVTSE